MPNTIDPQTLRELNEAFRIQPGGFLVVDAGRPRFAVLDFQTYQSLREPKATVGRIKKVLVTGGAGYVGSVTTQVLQDAGLEVVVFDNLSTGRRERVQNCKLVVADLADRDALDKIFSEEHFDAVVHFAASIEVEESVLNPGKYFQNNVVNGLNLLDAMIKHGVLRMVFSSSAAVYGEADVAVVTEKSPCQPANPYGESKLIFEKFLAAYGQAYGLDSVSLRYFNAAGAWPGAGLGYDVHGAKSHLIPRVLDAALGKTSGIKVFGNDYPTPDGTGVRDYIHILDLAEAHTLALKKLDTDGGVNIYNVGTGRGHSVLEVIATAVEVTGRMVPMTHVPRRAGDPAKLVADSSRLQKEFNWRPRHDLTSILESAWEWHKHNS